MWGTIFIRMSGASVRILDHPSHAPKSIPSLLIWPLIDEEVCQSPSGCDFVHLRCQYRRRDGVSKHIACCETVVSSASSFCDRSIGIEEQLIPIRLIRMCRHDGHGKDD